MATFSERVKELRKEKGMTQTDLAAHVHVTKGTVSTWETGSRMPGFTKLDDLCEAFDCRMDYLIGATDVRTRRIPPKEEEDVRKHNIEDSLTDFALKYARLDAYGQESVEAVINAEYNRCLDMNSLADRDDYSCKVRINWK